jgi:hypothetical protein
MQNVSLQSNEPRTPFTIPVSGGLAQTKKINEASFVPAPKDYAARAASIPLSRLCHRPPKRIASSR